jgi:hypothetical protein
MGVDLIASIVCCVFSLEHGIAGPAWFSLEHEDVGLAGFPARFSLFPDVGAI